MYPDTKLISPDLYVIHAGSDAHAYTLNVVYSKDIVMIV